MEELRFQSPAKPEDVVDGRDFRSGFVEAADLPAIAAVWGHTHQSAPTHRPEGSGGEAGRRGTAGSMAWHDRLHCSEGTPQGDIQDPGRRGKTDNLYFLMCCVCFRRKSNFAHPLTVWTRVVMMLVLRVWLPGRPAALLRRTALVGIRARSRPLSVSTVERVGRVETTG